MKTELSVLLLFCSFLTELSYSSPTPKEFQCNFRRLPVFVTEIQNGTSMDWFQMQGLCQENNGKLVWLNDNYNVSTLAPYLRSLNTQNYSWYDFLVIGLIGSAETTNNTKLMWADKNSNVCGSVGVDVCSSYVKNESYCATLGCCWKNQTCLYPDPPIVTTYNIGGQIEGLPMTKEIQCIGLKKFNNTFSHAKWTAFNCFGPVPDNAGFVCEYKCNDTLPDAPTVMNTITTSLGSTTTITDSPINGSVTPQTSTLSSVNGAEQTANTTSSLANPALKTDRAVNGTVTPETSTLSSVNGATTTANTTASSTNSALKTDSAVNGTVTPETSTLSSVNGATTTANTTASSTNPALKTDSAANGTVTPETSTLSSVNGAATTANTTASLTNPASSITSPQLPSNNKNNGGKHKLEKVYMLGIVLAGCLFLYDV